MRILLIADDPLARAGLAALLFEAAELSDQDIQVVAQLNSEDAEIDTAPARYQADIALWDMGWEPSENLDRLSEFMELGLPVVILLSTPEQAKMAWQTGIRGMLARDADGAQIIASLVAADQGLAVLDPSMTVVLPLDRAAQAQEAILETLTPREFDVLQLVAEGAPNKEIARRLSISDHTVKYHVNAILGKLDAQSRTEAVVRATRAGLILL